MTQEREPLWRVMLDAYDQSIVPDELLESADAYDCLTDSLAREGDHHG